MQRYKGKLMILCQCHCKYVKQNTYLKQALCLQDVRFTWKYRIQCCNNLVIHKSFKHFAITHSSLQLYEEKNICQLLYNLNHWMFVKIVRKKWAAETCKTASLLILNIIHLIFTFTKYQ